MIDLFKQFIADMVRGGRSAVAPGAGIDETRLAAAALMVHVIGVDGTITEAERGRFERALAKHYGLDAAGIAALSAAAHAADHEAVDLYAFTSVLQRRLDAEGRLKIVELLWTMVFADGALHEFEDNAVWRIADLLGISTRERVLLRKTVEAKIAAAQQED